MVRFVVLAAVLLSSHLTMAFDCPSNLTPKDPTVPVQEVVLKIKATLQATDTFPYETLANQLTAFKEQVNKILWIIEDDQEGRYRSFISFAYALNRLTVYVPFFQEFASIEQAFAEIQKAKNLLAKNEDPALSLAADYHHLIKRIDDLHTYCSQFMQRFYHLKGTEGKRFNDVIQGNAIGYAPFTLDDWNALGHCINHIPFYVSSCQYHLELMKTELQNMLLILID